MWQQGGQQGGQGIINQGTYFGSHNGHLTDFTQNNNLSLVAVRGRHGALVDQIQFLFIDINTHQYVESPACGGSGGSEFMFQAPPGQWINKIMIRVGACIDAIQFRTNQGVASPSFGGNGGGPGEYETHGRITGFKARSENCLNGLCMIVSE